MKFEDIIKKVSAIIASLFIFFIASGMYLSIKGFVMDSSNNLVLVSNAQARPDVDKKISSDIVLPKGHILGKDNAPITIYEYSSFTCFHCADFHLDVLPKLKQEFIDTGKVKVIFADFPIDKKAMQAAMVAACIPQNNYFKFVDLLFRKQREWSMSSKTEKLLAQYASLNGITEEQAVKCMSNEVEAKEIMNTRQNAVDQLGIMGTPSLLIVKGNNRELLPGAPSYSQLKEILDNQLTEK